MRELGTLLASEVGEQQTGRLDFYSKAPDSTRAARLACTLPLWVEGDLAVLKGELALIQLGLVVELGAECRNMEIQNAVVLAAAEAALVVGRRRRQR